MLLDKEYIETDPQCPQVWKDIHRLPTKKWFYIYTLLEIIGGVAEFAITLTKGGVPRSIIVSCLLCQMGMAIDYTER